MFEIERIGEHMSLNCCRSVHIYTDWAKMMQEDFTLEVLYTAYTVFYNSSFSEKLSFEYRRIHLNLHFCCPESSPPRNIYNLLGVPVSSSQKRAASFDKKTHSKANNCEN